MFALLKDFFKNNKNNKKNLKQNLSRDLLETLNHKSSTNKVIKALKEEGFSEEKIETINLVCQLFSYRLVIRSNDIPISYSLLEELYDQLAEKMYGAEVDKSIDEIKEQVQTLLNVYKNCEQRRKSMRVEQAAETLTADLLNRSTPQVKGKIKEKILYYVTSIQDFFTMKTSQL